MFSCIYNYVLIHRVDPIHKHDKYKLIYLLIDLVSMRVFICVNPTCIYIQIHVQTHAC